MRALWPLALLLSGCTFAAPDAPPDLTDRWPLAFRDVIAGDYVQFAPGGTRSYEITFDGPHEILAPDGSRQEAWRLHTRSMAGDGATSEPSGWAETQWLDAAMHVVREDTHVPDRMTTQWWLDDQGSPTPLPNYGLGWMRILQVRGGLVDHPNLNQPYNTSIEWIDHDWTVDPVWRLTYGLQPSHELEFPASRAFEYGQDAMTPILFADAARGSANSPPPTWQVERTSIEGTGILFPGSANDPLGLGFTTDDAWSALVESEAYQAHDSECLVDVHWTRDSEFPLEFQVMNQDGGTVWLAKQVETLLGPQFEFESEPTSTQQPCPQERLADNRWALLETHRAAMAFPEPDVISLDLTTGLAWLATERGTLQSSKAGLLTGATLTAPGEAIDPLLH